MDHISQARDKLVAQLVYHPDVTLIDIGYAPDDTKHTGDAVLRIHVREQWAKADPAKRATFPEEMDGIPVIVMIGNYPLEDDPPGREFG